LLRQAPDVEAAAVVSFDGLPMASALPAGMDEDRVAAMSAALLSLGERAAQGLGRGDLSQVYVEGDNGTVFLVSADDEAVLVAVGRAGAKVGLMLFEVKQAAAAVGTALRIQAEPLPPLVHPAPELAAPEPVAPEPQAPPVQQAPQPVPVQQVQAQPVQVQPVQMQPVQMQPVQLQDEPQQVPGDERDADGRHDDDSAADRFPHLAPAAPVHQDDRRPAAVASDGSSWS
jgi:predicted regulator of Ras-like GTPase activity (Roadblock/LC7/MglB family)